MLASFAGLGGSAKNVEEAAGDFMLQIPSEGFKLVSRSERIWAGMLAAAWLGACQRMAGTGASVSLHDAMKRMEGPKDQRAGQRICLPSCGMD